MTKQLEINGTEQTKNADIERALDKWLEGKDIAKQASEDLKLRHATLLLHVTTAGLQVYSYLDPRTGKRKRIRVATDPKIKAEADGPRGRKKRERDVETDVEKAERKAAKLEAKAAAQANTVESRRVKRDSVEELREETMDPFAATRRAMDEGVH